MDERALQKSVIPGRRAAASPESMATNREWIPGSDLRSAPEDC